LETGSVDVNALMMDEKDGKFREPLMYAVTGRLYPAGLGFNTRPYPAKELCRLLLKHGARVSGLRNNNGVDLINIARVENPSVVPLLEEARQKE